MKRRLCIYLFLIAPIVGVFSQELVIGVTPLIVRGGFTGDEAETISDLFLTELSKHKTIKVVDHRQETFRAITRQMKIEASDWFNDEKIKQFGRALKVNAIVRLSSSVLGDQRIIMAWIINIDSEMTHVLASGQMMIKNTSEVLGKLPVFTQEIVKNLPPPPLANPFIGRWRSTITSNGQTLICILDFDSGGSIDVEQYDTNRVTRHLLGASYSNDIKKGSGDGTYSFRKSGNDVIADISLTISGVSHEFIAVTARVIFNASNPNQFTANSMQCEYYVTGKDIEGWYRKFNRM